MASDSSILRIGITGHRQVNSPDEVTGKLISIIRNILNERKANSFIGYSALAYGADTLFVNAAKQFNASLKGFLPFQKKIYEKDFDKPGTLAAFNILCEEINPVELSKLKEGYTKQDRNKAYYDCGIHIANQCDVMIAVWNGQPPKGHGGTSEIVDYCFNIGIPVYFVYLEPTPFETEGDALINLYRQIVITYARYSALAKNAKDEFVSNWKRSVYLGTASALVLIAGIIFNPDKVVLLIFSALEIVLFLIFWVNVRYIVRKEMNCSRIFTRLAAERLRILKIFCQSGIGVADKPFLTLHSNKHKQNEEIASQNIIRNLENHLNTILQNLNTVYVSATDNLKYIVNDQQKWQQNRADLHRQKLITHELYLKVLKYAFLSVLLIHFGLVIFEWKEYHIGIVIDLFAKFLLLSIPTFYLTIEGFIYFNEWKRSVKNAADMVAFYSHIKTKLDQTGIDIHSVANEIRSKMLDENASWEMLLFDKIKPTEIQ